MFLYLVVHEEDSKEKYKIEASNEYASTDKTYYNMEENALLPRGAVMLFNLWDYVQEKTHDGCKLSEEFEVFLVSKVLGLDHKMGQISGTNKVKKVYHVLDKELKASTAL
ncbi:hypothetical protein CHS0354_032036 [Potamilus streckersoni]|uniref:Uncharacterized protein n=1 Tax=Potamilus streckersoni TaxID=2493646 RepID=A0AAE0TL13_9BIVA|nr:hypothetical protein CHS0354_032036 [Potamilus streckersoni]